VKYFAAVDLRKVCKLYYKL